MGALSFWRGLADDWRAQRRAPGRSAERAEAISPQQGGGTGEGDGPDSRATPGRQEAAAATSRGEERSPVGAHEDLAAVREEVLRTHPDVVPELVAGGTVAELLASVEPARAAYERVRAAAEMPPVVASPLPRTTLVDPAELTSTELIKHGLAERRMLQQLDGVGGRPGGARTPTKLPKRYRE